MAIGTPRFNAQREIAVEKETSLSGLIDAGGNIGICALQFATDLLISKARTSGFAIVGIHDSAPPGTGPAGYYAERIARGKVSLAWSFAAQARWLRLTGAVNALLVAIRSRLGFPRAANRWFWTWRPR